MRLKLFEQYNRNQTLLGLAKMGLRTGRKEVFDLAVKRGLDMEDVFYELKDYCEEIVNYNSLEWIFIDKQEYLDCINFFTRIFDIGGKLTDLKKVEKLKNLNLLDCSNNNLTDLKGVEQLKKLIHFDCSNNNLTNLKGIEQLINIKILICSKNNLTNLKGIENLTSLGILICSENNLTNLKGIEQLKNITILDCSENNLTNLKGVEKLENLNNLKIMGCNNLPQEIKNYYEVYQQSENKQKDMDRFINNVQMYYTDN